MLISGVFIYVGLTILGIDYAIVFAVFTALLVLVPYFGAIISAIPPTLFALTESPGKALLVLAVYVGVHQLEGNVIIPLVYARTVKLHPAVIAVGVVIIGELLGIVGLLVAVPILSLLVICVEEIWVKPMEEADRRRRREELEALEPPPEELSVRAGRTGDD
jgi:predicted PurR-regulated permease PerM